MDRQQKTTAFKSAGTLHGACRVSLPFVFIVILWLVPAAVAQREAAPPQAPSASPAASPSTTPAQAGEFPGYRFAVGGHVAYHVDYTSISNADLRVLFQNQKGGAGSPAQSSALAYDLSAGLRGETSLTTVKAGPDRIQIFQVFHKPLVRLIINGQDQAQQAAEVARELERGFLLEMTPQGKVTAIYMQPGADKFSKDFTRTLVAVLQFLFPAEPPSDGQSWTVREDDRNGAYLAQYRIVSASVPGHHDWIDLHKSVLRYLPETPEPAAQEIPGRTETPKKVVPRMDMKARFDLVSGRLVSLRGAETEDTIIQGKKVAHTETALHVVRSSHGKAAAAALARAQKLSAALRKNSPQLTLYARRSRREVEGNIQRTELGTATLKQLMGMLSTLDDSSLPPDKQQDAETPVYLKFKALIYVHPEICAQLGKTLAAANPSSPAFRILSRALGAVAHPQAQSALVHAIKAHPRGGDAQAGLIATLGGAPSPTAEAEMAVHALAVGSPDPNVSSAAILALGSMAKNLARKEPKRSGKIVDFLAHWADTSHSDEQRQHLLQALGNTASSRAMPLLSRYAADRSPVLRAAAVDAMRFIELPKVDGLLLRTLGSDKDAHVRLEAAFALGYRKPDQQSYAAQKKALAADDDEKVRAALLTNLAKMSKQFPDVRTLLKNAASDDPSDYVRQVATGLLQQMGG